MKRLICPVCSAEFLDDGGGTRLTCSFACRAILGPTPRQPPPPSPTAADRDRSVRRFYREAADARLGRVP